MDLMQRSVSVTYDNSLSKEMIYNDIDVANIHRTISTWLACNSSLKGVHHVQISSKEL